MKNRYWLPLLSALALIIGLSIVAAPQAKANAPHITNIAPASGQQGTQVTITGTALAPFSTVKFDGVATSYTITNNNQVVAIAPAHADGAVQVKVETPFGVSNSVTFTYGTGAPTTTPPPAPTKKNVGPGTSIMTGDGPFAGGSWCTVGAVGRDDHNRLVAVTAGHCNTAPGQHQPVYWSPTVHEPNKVQLGTFETMNTHPEYVTTYPVRSSHDYAVILLDESVVNPINVTPTGQVYNRNSTTPIVEGVTPMSKYGQVSGWSSCIVDHFEDNVIFSGGCSNLPGDSGGGIWIDGFAGVNSATNPFIGDGRNNQFTHISGILADIASQGPNTVGIGFEPLP